MERLAFPIPLLVLTSLLDAEWYKGNTHAHTVLCGHADSTPEAVAGWYHDHGYNFLVLSEHNKFIDPATVDLGKDPRKDFLLVPGQEVTGHKVIHTTALDIEKLVPWDADGERSHIIQSHVHGAREAGGTTILNHPNFKWAVKPEDILPVEHLYLFELYNGHPAVANFGDAHHMSTEKMWDQLLDAGMTIYAVASDDAHHFAKLGENHSNPGRGWVMVQADKLDSHAITHAMLDGDFYASSGIILKTMERTRKTISVEVDTCATDKELASPNLYGSKVREGQPGYRIEFLGKEGKTLETVEGTSAKFDIPDCQPYVRCKVSLLKEAEEGRLKGYYAWIQPVFTDKRSDPLLGE